MIRAAYVIRIAKATLDVTRIRFRNLAGTSGRLDAACRCVISTLRTEKGSPRSYVKVYLVIDKGDVVLLDPNRIMLEELPISEVKMARMLLKLYDKGADVLPRRGLLNLVKDLRHEGYNVVLVHERGENWMKCLSKILSESKEGIAFILGGPYGIPREEEERLMSLNIPMISLGERRYLSSYCIAVLNFLLQGGEEFVRQVSCSI